MKRTRLQIMLRLIGLVRPLSGFMVLAVVLGILGFLCAIFLPVVGSFGIMGAAGIPVSLSIRTCFIILALCAVLRGVLRYGEQACNHYIAFKLLALIRDRVFRSLRKLCPAKLEGRDRGDLISLITSDIELLEVFYAHTISPALIAAAVSLFMTIFIGSFHPILGGIAFTGYIVIGIFIPMIVSKQSGNIGMVLRTRAGELSSYVLESLRGLVEIIQYGTGQNRINGMVHRTNEWSDAQRQQSDFTSRSSALTGVVILLFDLTMLAAAAALHQSGTIDSIGLTLSVVCMMSSFGPVIALANLGTTLQSTLAAGDRVLDLLEEQPQVEQVHGRDGCTFNGATGRQITFSYGKETILDHVSLSIPQNTIVGITGRSGSGKSTLLKLLMRFWDTSGGQVLISERPIQNINTSDLRAMESFVEQDTHLFHDSIENNIRLAKLDATHEEIVNACQKAALHEFILSLPHGYATPVGELGDTLSGGEKQRIGLARAFLHDAPLILLDEPTSNLDSLNEASILRSLNNERKGKTIVLVSHRASTMRIADKVYSVEKGRIS
ncbi:thiol reductant ABC exporter subunit CydC [uncultured Ruthenibacterium sp.]|uniref:thiol reductant ABC exporter subunit CydC n=1 Tax=uncultured Ruthenibacterium sp. TaxID=1905347 RepID=UPI00349E4B19